MFLKRHLVEQFFPIGIVIAFPAERGQRQAVLFSVSGLFCIRIFGNRLFALQVAQHFVGNGNADLFFGKGARPVVSRNISHFRAAPLVLIQVGKIEPVGDCVSRIGRNGICSRIELVVFPNHFRKVALSVFIHSVLRILRRFALQRKNIIGSFVRPVRSCEIILSLV